MGSVLVAGKCPSARARIRACLTERGYASCEADTSLAVEEAKRSRPLLSILVASDGEPFPAEALSALRNDPGQTDLPILILSGSTDPAAPSGALSAGSDDWLPLDTPAPLLMARIDCLVERCQLKRRSMLNQRMAQLGHLVAGIVHEIRGPLSVIGGNAEIMLMSLPPEAPALLWAEPILRTVRVLQKRLDHLMGAVRIGTLQLDPVELSELAREASHIFLRGTDPRRSRITIEMDMPADLPDVQADAGRVLLILLNLLGNAHEAVSQTPRETKIRVRAGTREEDSRSWIVLEVADNGPGISEMNRSRIFEPFFTTKPEGSGYGLYLADQLMREQGGRLVLADTTDAGTTFSLWFPVEAPHVDDTDAASGVEPSDGQR